MLRYAPFQGPEIFWVIPSHSRFSEAPCGQCNRPLRYWILVHCILSDGIWSWFLWRNILKARVVGCFWSRSLPFLPLWLWLFVSFCFWAALFWVQLWMVSGFNLSDPWSLRCPSGAARYFAVASSSCAARFLPTPLPCPKLEQQHPGMRSPADPQHGMENQQGAATRQRVCDRARYAWRWLPTNHANIYIYTHDHNIFVHILYWVYTYPNEEWLLSASASDAHQLELSAIASCSGGINYHLRMVHSGYLRLQIQTHFLAICCFSLGMS